MLGELDFALALSQAGRAAFGASVSPFVKWVLLRLFPLPHYGAGSAWIFLSLTRLPPPLEYIYLHPHLEGSLIDGRRKDIGKKK